MGGTPLSRWTMSYFAAALLFLFCGLALMVGGFGYPSAEAGAPETLVVVHLVAVGWLGLLFCGALLQFIPVLAAKPLRMAVLSLPSLGSIALGLGCLICGFLSLSGVVEVDPLILMCGAALLLGGLLSLAACFAWTILCQAAMDLPSRLVLLGLLALVATIGMGAVFAAGLSGAIGETWTANILAAGVPLHAAFGTLGWMTITAAGVSYRLFSMFMLAPERGSSAQRVLVGVFAALLCLFGSLATAAVAAQLWMSLAIFAVIAALGAATFYFRDLTVMLRTRRRERLELNTTAGLAALGFLALGLLLLAWSLIYDGGLPLGSVAYYLLCMGWLSGLGLAQLYKIVPFLTWLEAYGPIMGRSPVPRVQDLVDERHGRLAFTIYYCSVLAAAVSLSFGLPLGFRWAAAGQFAAVSMLVLEYVRARRLSHVRNQANCPAGTIRPQLVYVKQT